MTTKASSRFLSGSSLIVVVASLAFGSPAAAEQVTAAAAPGSKAIAVATPEDQATGPQTSQADADNDGSRDIVVTGFRKSLQDALSINACPTRSSMRSRQRTSPTSPMLTWPNQSSACPAFPLTATMVKVARSRCAASVAISNRFG
ncbi:hypothetical protein [Sphingomonas sp. HMP6]|uniref:hypothetical protein n=1 Tax=Sphingomonas sp. HMP6 TaxID=1517551 RepID=UPI001E56FD19|nr:hypothetical protein [Sphingomonas sp. HMP6]